MPNSPILNSAYLAPESQGALNPTVWQTNPTMALLSAIKGRGLFGALAMKEQAALDQQSAALNQQRLEAQNRKTNELLTASPKDEILSPADLYRYRATGFANAGLLDEANKMGDLAKKLDNDLEMKDGVWYDKRTGKPYAAGHMINQSGFGVGTALSPTGQISMGPLHGAQQTYGLQQQIGEAAKAQYDLQKVPATSPTSQPRFDSRLNLLQQGGAAGMSPVQEAGVAADAAQSLEVSKNFGTIYNNLQNSSMQNPAKIAKLQQIGNLLGDFEGGKFSKSAMGLAQAFNSAGIKIDPRLPNKEAAEALTGEIALELRNASAGAGMPGHLSDQDREFLKGMTPQRAQTAEGRKTIINSRVKLMERDNQIANMARQYRQKYGKLDDSFFGQLQDWSNRNQIFKK
jgi:hypothetical protein